MKIKLLAGVLIWFFVFGNAVFAQSSIITFQKTIQMGVGEPRCVIQTNDSNYIISGYYWDNLTGWGWTNACLIRISQNGNILWAKSYGKDIHNNAFNSVYETTDSGFIAGGKSGGSIYLIKTNSLGDTLWEKGYHANNSGDGTRSVQQTNDHGFIVAGSTYISASHPEDVYLVKTDSVGNLLWSKSYGRPTENDFGFSALQTYDGGYAVLGLTDTSINQDYYLIKTDSIGNLIWSKTYAAAFCCSILKQTTDSGFILVGNSSLIKTDVNGDTLWTKYYNVNNATGGSLIDVNQTEDGGYIVSGNWSFNGNGSDVYLMKTDGSGNVLWSKKYGGTLPEYGGSVLQTKDGGYFIAGTVGYPVMTTIIYIIKTDSSGNSGCNENNVITTTYNQPIVVAIPNTVVSSPATIVYTPYTEVDYGAVSTIICISTNIDYPFLKSEVFQYSPNPVTDKVTISFPSTTSENITIKIYSITGEAVFAEENKTVTDYFTKTIDVKDFSNGIYFLSVQMEKEKITRKIIINH